MKKNRKSIKGFTLVELLAVIMVLAIIMVIATQSINNVVKKARTDTYYETVQAIKKGASTVCITKGNISDIDTLKRYVDYDDVEVIFATDDYIMVSPMKDGKFDNIDAANLSSIVNGKFSLKDNNSIIFKSDCSVGTTNVVGKLKITPRFVDNINFSGNYAEIQTNGTSFEIYRLGGYANINGTYDFVTPSADDFDVSLSNNKLKFNVKNGSSNSVRYYCVIEVKNENNLPVVYDFGDGNFSVFQNENWESEDIHFLPNYLAWKNDSGFVDAADIVSAAEGNSSKLIFENGDMVYFLVEVLLGGYSESSKEFDFIFHTKVN